VFSQQEKLRIDVLKRFGVYSTESNGHLSEYLPWYRKRPEEITKWIDMSDWIHGETGGYLRHSTETRNWFETEFPQFLASAEKPIDPSKRSNEHASHILEALETGRVYRGHFNVKNNGVITNLPATRLSNRPASSIASASTWFPASPFRKPARRPAWPRSMSSACRSTQPSAATSIC
jgi:alpha-galactosidase